MFFYSNINFFLGISLHVTNPKKEFNPSSWFNFPRNDEFVSALLIISSERSKDVYCVYTCFKGAYAVIYE